MSAAASLPIDGLQRLAATLAAVRDAASDVPSGQPLRVKSAPAAAPATDQLLDDCASCEPTDVGNGARLALRAGGHLVAVTGGGWLEWDGTRWAPDDGENSGARRWAIKTAQAIKDETKVLEARGLPNADIAKRFTFGLSSQGAPKLNHMLGLARIPLGRDAADFDRAAELLNTPTGTVDLRTGRARPHSRKDWITKRTLPGFHADAAAPSWEAFLEQVLPDAELRAYVQRLAGYLLTGHTGEQKLFALLGTGANGKSVFVRSLLRVLGDYAVPSSVETFMVSRRGGGDTRSDLVRLRGARLVTVSESSDGMRFDDRLLKEITGGEQIVARTLHATEQAFTPVLKLVLSCNALPRFDGSDYAMRRRLKVIPFSVTIADSDQDQGLPARLDAEAAGILAWAVRGAQIWCKQGLGTCDAVEQASADSAEAMDPVGLFIEERCERVEGQGTPTKLLIGAYTGWAEENRQPKLDGTKLGSSLGRHGFMREKRRWVTGAPPANGWWGIVLKPIGTSPVPPRTPTSRDISMRGSFETSGSRGCEGVRPAEYATSGIPA